MDYDLKIDSRDKSKAIEEHWQLKWQRLTFPLYI